ncbi:MAG: hypothetical protein PHQ25_05885 [Acidobacteriota bacterium]|nr:hypothetical protein [Acidobacteriota bacterium]MDW3229779.1 hypothetical protein [Acidobacteriota bacterium]
MVKTNPEKDKKFWTLRTRLNLLICILVVGSFLACSGQSPIKGLAVSLEFGEKVLTDDLVTSLIIKFITTSDFKPLGKDYQIEAVADWQGETLFEERLEPEVPTSKWIASRVYEIKKHIYIPKFIDPFDPAVASGQKINFKLRLTGADLTQPIVLDSRKIKILCCPPEAPVVVFLDGWERVKKVPTMAIGPAYELWTKTTATCLLKNLGQPATLMIKGQSFLEGQKVSLFLNGSLLSEFVTEVGGFQKVFSISPPDPESQPEMALTIKVDKTVGLSEIYPDIKEDKKVGLKIDKVYFR